MDSGQSVFSKREIRAQALARRDGLTAEERKLKSGQMARHIFALPEWEQAGTLMLYMNFRTEAETGELVSDILKRKKRLILPRCLPHGLVEPLLVQDLARDMESGRWGISEPKATCPPVNPQEIDLILIPGVAFDCDGNRLGYGAGFYDRFLPLLKEDVPRIGWTFFCQIFERIPAEPHDQTMTMLISEEGVFPCLRKGRG